MRQLIAMPILLATIVSTVAEERQGASRWLEIHEVASAVRKAPSGKQTGVQLCWLSAYSRDKTSTNLRNGPGPRDKVIAKVPAERDEGGTKIGPEFQIIAGRGDRFLVRGVHWAGYDLPEKELALGPAWMAANLMGFSLESPNLRDVPRETGKVILEMRPREGERDDWGADSAKIDRVYGCSGSFIDVAVTLPDGRKARGWATGLCANQVTTCGGGHVSAEERRGGLYLSEANCAAGTDNKDCPKPASR